MHLFHRTRNQIPLFKKPPKFYSRLKHSFQATKPNFLFFLPLFGLGFLGAAYKSFFSSGSALAEEEKQKNSSEDGEFLFEPKKISKNFLKHYHGQAPIYRIVLTGGPCGGKSTALAQIHRHLSALGFRVYMVPEAATILLGGGCQIRDVDLERYLIFQTNLIKMQMALEDRFYSVAKSTSEPSVLIMDRGVMDAKAYVSDEGWEMLLNDQDWNVVSIRDKRYDTIIHLVTAANGAEKYYTTENNLVRSETMEQARALDLKILNAWIGHPKLSIVDNSTDFDGKMRRVLDYICRDLGLPQSGFEKRFLIQSPLKELPVHYEEFEIEQIYLASAPGTQSRVTRRSQYGTSTYTYSVKQYIGGRPVVLERQLSGREFSALLKQADPSYRVIRKKEQCFLWENQCFTLNYYFITPEVTHVVLEAITTDADIKLPPFISDVKDVTETEEYTSFSIATSGSTSPEPIR
eukprot:TRINITY_DN8094_c0_g1_i4.p1 TRINITY_DN8094_c0_g1~~TRINITY_DN8094_c0_g1_i4.p1  ORF type:complete len:462 (-),score=87.80 TRINITY_DN8094_c0_g1_i4:63-1448(-)